MTEQAIKLIAERAEEAERDPWKWQDVAFALGTLKESGTDAIQARGRVETIHDLQRRCRAAEQTSDPAVLQDLYKALDAFLTEELDAAVEDEAATEPTKSLDANESEDESEDDDSDVDARISELRQRAEKDAFMKYQTESAAARYFTEHWQGGSLSRPRDDGPAARRFKRYWHPGGVQELRERAVVAQVGQDATAADYFRAAWDAARR